jgi:hypothetical protein
MYRFLWRLFVLLWMPTMVMAEAAATVFTSAGLGDVAENLLEPVSLLSDFMSSACFVIGLSFLFASVVKYIEHRRSPLMVPISTVVFLFILAILLLLLPLAHKITESGVTHSFIYKDEAKQPKPSS